MTRDKKMNHQMLTLANTASFVHKHTNSILRIARPQKNKKEPDTYDPAFPKLIIKGRSIFIPAKPFFKWLSDIADEEITANDELWTSKEMQAYYQKSNTWLWQHEKAGNIPHSFLLNRSKLWIKRNVIVGEVEEAA